MNGVLLLVAVRRRLAWRNQRQAMDAAGVLCSFVLILCGLFARVVCGDLAASGG